MNGQTDLVLPPDYREGSLGMVIPDRVAGSCVKMFKRAAPDEMSLMDRPWENDLRRETFAAEVAAYQAAMTSPALRQIVPEFQGRRTPRRLLDGCGKDISARFLIDCCFAMRWVEKPFVKLCSSGTPVVSSAEYERVARMFGEVGVHHIADASVAVDTRTGAIIFIVDFAMRDAYYEGELRRLS